MSQVLFLRQEDLAGTTQNPAPLVTGNLIQGAGSSQVSDTGITTAALAALIAAPPATGNVTGGSTSTDGEVVLYSGTGGQTIKRSNALTGILKMTAGVASIAVASTDYAPATSGSAILKGNGSGGFSNAAAGIDYTAATSGSAILKGNGAGGTASATSGTDYLAPPSGTAILKANSGGALANATAGTDYVNKDTTSLLTAGFTATSTSGGTITGSGQTFTPVADSTHAGFQHITLNGSSLTGTFTFAVPAAVTTIVVEVTNGGSGAVAAALATAGYTKVTGDTWAGTNGSKWIFYVTKTNGNSHLHIQALQ